MNSHEYAALGIDAREVSALRGQVAHMCLLDNFRP